MLVNKKEMNAEELVLTQTIADQEIDEAIYDAAAKWWQWPIITFFIFAILLFVTVPVTWPAWPSIWSVWTMHNSSLLVWGFISMMTSYVFYILAWLFKKLQSIGLQLCLAALPYVVWIAMISQSQDAWVKSFMAWPFFMPTLLVDLSQKTITILALYWLIWKIRVWWQLRNVNIG